MVYSAADHFSECVESHAFETYDKFLKVQGGIMDISFVFFFCHLCFYSLFTLGFMLFSLRSGKPLGHTCSLVVIIWYDN